MFDSHMNELGFEADEKKLEPISKFTKKLDQTREDLQKLNDVFKEYQKNNPKMIKQYLKEFKEALMPKFEEKQQVVE